MQLLTGDPPDGVQAPLITCAWTRFVLGAITCDEPQHVGGTCFRSDKLFATRTLAARFTNRWTISYEDNLPIWICGGIKKPLSQVWPSLKSYE